MKYNILLSNIDTFNKISQYDKISINNNILHIDKKNIYRPLNRYINKQNREKSYLFIFKNIIQKCLEEIKKYLYFFNGKSKFTKKDLNIKNINDYQAFIKKFKNLKKSLNIFKTTYKHDKIFKRKIELMIENIIMEERKLGI